MITPSNVKYLGMSEVAVGSIFILADSANSALGIKVFRAGGESKVILQFSTDPNSPGEMHDEDYYNRTSVVVLAENPELKLDYSLEKWICEAANIQSNELEIFVAPSTFGAVNKETHFYLRTTYMDRGFRSSVHIDLKTNRLCYETLQSPVKVRNWKIGFQQDSEFNTILAGY